ncbi:MAG TPA: PAS domain S-box protein [Thermoanaerobaculia bacterium]|nr:PAS domain S-box protein [Thermoanaerobaculia bacterium]
MSLVRRPAQKAGRGVGVSRDERLRAGFDGAGVGIAFAAPDGHWLQVNEHFRGLIGYTREELSRISFHSITHPEDAKRETALVKKLVAGEVGTYRIEKRVMEKKGRYRTIEVVVSLARGPKGEPDFFIYVVDEPPARRAAMAQESSLADLLSDVAVIRTDEKGIVHGWNIGAERIFGYAANEIVGKNRRMLFRDADSWEGKSTRQLKAVTDRVEAEDWRVGKDGRHLWVRITLAPVRVEGVMKGYVEIITPPAPVDARRGLEATIESLRAEVETGRRKEESLRDALEEVRVMGEQTMNELRIMATALRKEIDRRKELEEQLREPVVEEEIVPVTAPPRAWAPLDGTAAALLARHADEQRTGTLIVAAGERELELEVFFEKGRVYSCASNDPASFLAQRLIDAGIIDDDDRRRAHELRQHTSLALGRILLILGAVTEEQLVDAMREKIGDELREMMTWRDARWAFVEGEVPSLQLVPLRLEVAELLKPPARLVASPSPKSRKYHTVDCISVRRIDAAALIAFGSVAEAMGRGYEACRICAGKK